MEEFRHKGWRFESESGPIANSVEREALTKRVEDATEATVPALPEAIFGKNKLTLTHEASGRAFHFNAQGAITSWLRESVAKGSGGIRVTSASLASWKEVADKELSKSAAADYDWTFTTDYCGTTTARGETEQKVKPATKPVRTPSFIESTFCTKVEYEAWLRAQHSEAGTGVTGTEPPAAPEPPWCEHKGDGFDMALLRRRDVPILHFLDLQLYEDDLGDNGDSMVRLRLRVMPTCFLVLLRHALRVDGVLIRHHDTRLFHKFGTPHVLRDRRLAEARLQPLPKLDPTNLLDAGSNSPTRPASPSPSSPEWAVAATLSPSRSASVPDEQEAAQRLATVPPKSESIEELLL